MNQEEKKAKALVMSFQNLVSRNGHRKENAKACAIVAVNEIISHLDNMCKPEYYSFWHGADSEVVDGYAIKEYWESVRVQIKKL